MAMEVDGLQAVACKLRPLPLSYHLGDHLIAKLSNFEKVNKTLTKMEYNLSRLLKLSKKLTNIDNVVKVLAEEFVQGTRGTLVDLASPPPPNPCQAAARLPGLIKTYHS